MSVELGKVICIADEAEAAARDEVLLAVAADPAIPPIEPPAPALGPGIHEGAEAGDSPAAAGQLFPQARVCLDGGDQLLEDAIGGGFVLYALDVDPERLLDAAGSDYLRTLGASFVNVTESLDPENVYRAWFELHGCRAALVRPDFYVFGTAVTAEETCELARHLEAALGSDQNDRGENQ